MAVQTTAGQVIGTPHYMAPELLLGAASDGRIDQYALAVTVYEVVCGRTPFDGQTPAALAVQQTTGSPPPPHQVSAGVPPAFSAALLRGLSRDPAQRYPDCRSLARALLPPRQATVAPAGGTPTIRSKPLPQPPLAPSPVPRPVGAGEYPCPLCGTVFRLPLYAGTGEEAEEVN
jgi:serine/threonine-protein kinase